MSASCLPGKWSDLRIVCFINTLPVLLATMWSGSARDVPKETRDRFVRPEVDCVGCAVGTASPVSIEPVKWTPPANYTPVEIAV